MDADLNAIIRSYAFALVQKIEETNKAASKTGGHPLEIGRNMAFGLSLFMLLNRLEQSGVSLDEIGLSEIDPLALVEGLPKTAETPRRVRRPYSPRRRH